MSESAEDLMIGRAIGSYRVERLLGEGGMGRVYLALHPTIGSRVAIKVLDPQAVQRQDLLDRFFAEAAAVNKIRHENIVNVLDLATLEEGAPYIVMEHLDGRPLADVLQRLGTLPAGTCAQMFIEILSALEAAHQAGVIHRDLKPDNIFISPRGRPKLLDFGIAKLLPESGLGAEGTTTKTGLVLGTPLYMSPEQISGTEVSPATDIYALGAILYHCLTGRPPFTGNTLYELMYKHLNQMPAALDGRPQVPTAVAAIALKALAKNPEERFPSAHDMADALSLAVRQMPAHLFDAIAITASDMHLKSIATPRSGALLAQNPNAGVNEAATQRTRTAPTFVEQDTIASEELDVGPRGSSTASATIDGVTTPDRDPRPSSGQLRTIVFIALGFAGVVAVAATMWLRNGAEQLSEPEHARPKPPSSPVSPAVLAKRPVGVAALPDNDIDASIAAAPVSAGGPVPRPAKSLPKQRLSPPTKSSPAPPPRQPSSDAASPLGASKSNQPGVYQAAGGAVTLINTAEAAEAETGLRPISKRVSTDAFNAAHFRGTAQKMARRLMADARLIQFEVDGTKSSGVANLNRYGEATYRFRSKQRSKRPRDVPRGIEVDIPCLVYVDVAKGKATAYVTTSETCDERFLRAPKCSLAEVWQRALRLGGPRGNWAADIDYMDNEWFFDVKGGDFSETIADDC